jgi:catalase
VTSLDRRVPARVRHAQGGGALGVFETGHDVSAYTVASLFQPGAQVDVVVRFSSTIGRLGSPDSWRDVRGFATKFLTADGHYDIVGNNSPVFFINDDRKFASLVVALKLHGDGALEELFDYDRVWRFWTDHPETAHQVTWLLSDRGIPRTWRHMDGFGAHTYQWINADGDRFWVKYHLRTDQGNEFLTQDETGRIVDTEVDYYSRDLSEAITRGDHPSWALSVQVMAYEDAKRYRFNPFDLTKVWPKRDYPLIPVGRLVLDRNPDDVVARIEQGAFSPSNFVPGIGPSPDTMLQARMSSYPNFQRARVVIGGPGSEDEPASAAHDTPDGLSWAHDSELLRAADSRHRDDDDFVQAGALVRTALDDEARGRLVSNIVANLSGVTIPDVRRRAIRYWTSVDEALGKRIEADLS